MNSETPVWFAMRVTYRREMAVKETLEAASLSCFIPMRYCITTRGGRKRRELVPAVRSLVFVYSTPTDIQRIKEGIPHLQYIVDRRTKTKIVVPEQQMQQFIAISGTHDDHLLYFRPDELNLAKGTRVRIHGGQFDGYEGVFIKVKGARDRRVVIALEGLLAVAMATIHPDLIEVIT